MSDRVDVAFGFDNGYAPHVAAVVASMLRYMPARCLRLLLLNSGVTPAAREGLEKVAAGATVQWIEIHKSDLPQFGERQHLGHVNEATFLRLGLEKLAPADCDRVIYLDADVTVMRDLREMWECSLEGCVVGGVPDTFIDENEFANRWGLPNQACGYFNAGVMLIDLKKVRAEKLFSRALDFIIEENPPFADQDALNKVAWGRWRNLDAAWNVQRDMLIAGLADQLPPGKKLAEGARPGVVHFTGRDKPWLPSGWHPWAWIYWINLRRTPFHRAVANAQHVGLLKEMLLFGRWLRHHPSSVAIWP